MNIKGLIMKKKFCFMTAVTLLSGVVQCAELTTNPLFRSCSIYFTGNGEGYKVKYRPSSKPQWNEGMPLVNSKNIKTWRASLLNLEENTGYEVQIADSSGKVIAQKSFTTASLRVPVASEKKLPAKGPVTIKVKGSPDGWIRYTANSVVDGGDSTEAAVLVDGAEYVIFENIRLTGGGKHGFQIKNSKNIRIVNCDISGWGRLGKRDYRRRGVLYDKEKNNINNDAGVFIDQSLNVLVERCFIHDPRGTANSWLFYHPQGPNAVFVHSLGGTVIRYNDFIGSDLHRWNDVVEGNRNGFDDGGFCRDAEVYGNIMLFGNDDGIELDGGQMNVKVWGNHFEGSLCGISTAPCLNGPTYAWNNLFIRPGDVDGIIGSAIKNGYRICGQGQIYLNNNTAIYKVGMNAFGKGKSPRRFMNTRNNVFDTESGFAYRSLIQEGNNMDFDLIWSSNKESYDHIKEMLKQAGVEKHGIFAEPVYMAPDKGDYRLSKSSPGYGKTGISGDIPLRPTPLKLDRKYIDFKENSSPVKITVSYSGKNARRFTILKNSAFSWLNVSPQSGVVGPGKEIVLSVKPTLQSGKRLKGAFVVKLDDGFSRPVVVYAGEKKILELDKSTPGCIALIDANKAEGGNKSAIKVAGSFSGKAVEMKAGKPLTCSFEVPASGWYFAALRFKPVAGLPWINLSIDNGPKIKSMMRGQDDWTWAGLSLVEKKRKGLFEPVKLSQGKHTITFTATKPFLLDQIAILSTPVVITDYIEPQK